MQAHEILGCRTWDMEQLLIQGALEVNIIREPFAHLLSFARLHLEDLSDHHKAVAQVLQSSILYADANILSNMISDVSKN